MHRYDNGWDFSTNTDTYLVETFELFAAGVRQGQDVAFTTSGMRAIVNELHGRALIEENERRRNAGLPTVRNGHKRFLVHAVHYVNTKPVIVDGRYTRSEKVISGPGFVCGFDTAQAASDYAYTLGTKCGNHDLTFKVDGQPVTLTRLKGLARKEWAARTVRA